MIFKTMAITIFKVWYCAFKDNNVVIVPAPAINGKAIGTIEAELAASSRYNRIPKIISKAKKNNTKEPATAKECTSIPIRFKNSSPIKRKTIIIKPATSEAFSDSMWPCFVLKSTTMGIVPTISITAKSTIPTVIISLKSNSMSSKIYRAKVLNFLSLKLN